MLRRFFLKSLTQAVSRSTGLAIWEFFAGKVKNIFSDKNEIFQKKFEMNFSSNFLLLLLSGLISPFFPKKASNELGNIVFASASSLYLYLQRDQTKNKDKENDKKSKPVDISKIFRISFVISSVNFFLCQSTIEALCNRKPDILPRIFFEHLISLSSTLAVNYVVEKYAPTASFEERKNLDFLVKNLVSAISYLR